MFSRFLLSIPLGTALLLLAACGGATPTPTPTPDPTPAPGGVVAYLAPGELQIEAGAASEVELVVASADVGISGVDVTIAFDPAAVDVSLAGLGDLLGPSPIAAVRKVDAQEGTIHLALARVGPTGAASTKGTLARLTVTPREGATGQTTLQITAIAVAGHQLQYVQQVGRHDATLSLPE